MPEWTGIGVLVEAGPYGLLLLVVWMIMTGRLHPDRVVRHRQKTVDAMLTRQDNMARAIDSNTETVAKLASSVDAYARAQETTQRMIDAIPDAPVPARAVEGSTP